MPKATAPAQPVTEPDLTEVRERRSAKRAQSAKEVQSQPPDQAAMLEIARGALIEELRTKFAPSPEFKDTFEAGWDDVKVQVLADAKVFNTDENDIVDRKAPDGSVTFTGRILGLYTEVTLKKDGAVGSVYFEID